MFKKVILATLLIGLASVLTVGANNRTVNKGDKVAGVSVMGRGQGDGEHSVDTATDQDRGQGRGQVGSRESGSAATGQRWRQDRDQENADGAGRGSGGAERQYPNSTEAPQDWATEEATVIQAPGDGVDLIIETGAGAEVQIGTGPGYLHSQGFELSAGEVVQVRGYWEGGEFKAAELIRLQGGETITLRDELGHPAWAGSGRRAQAAAGKGTGR